MNIEIKESKVFICPFSGKTFKTKKAAEKSAAQFQLLAKEKEQNETRAQKAKEQLEFESNFVRLNARSIKNFKPLIEQKAKEFWGWDVKINFQLHFGAPSNSHGAPLNGVENWNRDKSKPLNYLGWNGRVSGSLNNYITTNYSPSINDVIFSRYGKGFKGFHTSCGCPGTVNKTEMDIGFYCFLNDFPLIKEKYEIFINDRKKLEQYESWIEIRDEDACEWAENKKEIIDLDNKIEELKLSRNLLFQSYRTEYISDNQIDKPVINDNFGELKVEFSGY